MGTVPRLFACLVFVCFVFFLPHTDIGVFADAFCIKSMSKGALQNTKKRQLNPLCFFRLLVVFMLFCQDGHSAQTLIHVIGYYHCNYHVFRK